MAQWGECSPPSNVARIRFRPGVICGLSLLLVLVLATRGFLRVLRLSSLHKNQHSKFQFDLETLDEEPLSVGLALQIPIYLFYFLFFTYIKNTQTINTFHVLVHFLTNESAFFIGCR